MMSWENDTYLDFHVAFVKISCYITMYETKKSEYQCIPKSTDAD